MTFTARVIPETKGTPKPQGTVTFVDGSTTLGATSLNTNGVARFTTKTLKVGDHEVSAKYGGNTYFGPASSAPLMQTIEKASTELILKSSRNPAPYDSSTTLSATVKVLAPGSGTPGGSVKGLPVGNHEFQATYSGDENYKPSESAPLMQTITPILPTPEVAAINPSSGPESGGTTISIKGANFSNATEVNFGSKPAQRFVVNSPASIEAVSPVGTGAVDVIVATPAGGVSAATSADKFSFLPPQPVNAYSDYGSATAGHAMCRGNPERPESMPGGTATQTFTIPAGVAELSSAIVQIDPDNTVTAHMTLAINGAVHATTTALAAGDTQFSWPAVAVKAGDEASLSISFTATFGKIITVYSAAAVGGTLTYNNSCSDGAPSGSTANGLRAVVSGFSP